MKKNKLSNFLKTGILFFGISLLLWNCEDENIDYNVENQQLISIEQVKKQFNSSFNQDAFSKNISSPNWTENKVFYNKEGNQYLEIPFQTINQEDIDKGTSVSFDKLIAIPNNNKIELKIVHFFGIDIKNNIVNFKNISHTQLYNFSGFVTEYDLNKNVLGIKQYIKGKDTENEIGLKTKSKEDNSILARVDESTSEYTETICTRGCWYWESSNGSREFFDCSDYICETITYILGSGSEDGGNNSSGSNISHNTNEETINDNIILTVEIEQEYRSKMSVSELAIFESMPRHKQIDYLLNAHSATLAAENLFPNSLYNGIGDAFRHAYFNALNATSLGSNLAEQLATAHENKPNIYTYNYKENQMDLFNNAVGRTKSNWFSKGYRSLSDCILEAISKGELRYLSNLSGGGSSGRATNSSVLKPTN